MKMIHNSFEIQHIKLFFSIIFFLLKAVVVDSGQVIARNVFWKWMKVEIISHCSHFNVFLFV